MTLLAAALLLAPPVRFSEELRRETLTVSSFDSTESQSAERGKWRAEIETPLVVAPDATTEVEIGLGNYVFKARVGDDPAYRPGATRATLRAYLPSDDPRIRRVAATAELSWSSKGIRAKVEPKGDTGGAIAASKLADGGEGSVEGEFDARVRVGTAEWKASVPFRGRVKVTRRASGNAVGEVVEVKIASR